MALEALTLTAETGAGLAEDEQSLVAAARHEPEAAGRLFDRHYPAIIRYLYHSTLNHSVAEELTSNVFFAAFRRLGLFRWRGIAFRAWLYRIATNELRMHFRRQKRLLARQAGPVDPEHPSEGLSAAAVAAAQDDYRLLHRALLALDEKYRTVIVLHYLEGRSLADIGEITGRREGTIKSQLHRGLSQLKQALERVGVGPTATPAIPPPPQPPGAVHE
jgi:RNA polymerase sigma-70 factor, ECF subfamily